MEGISTNQNVWTDRKDIWSSEAITRVWSRSSYISDKDLKFFCQVVVESVVYSLGRAGIQLYRQKGSIYLCNSSDTNYYMDPEYLRLYLENAAIILGLNRTKARSLYFSDKLLRQFMQGSEILKLADKHSNNPDYCRLVSDLENTI